MYLGVLEDLTPGTPQPELGLHKVPSWQVVAVVTCQQCFNYSLA